MANMKKITTTRGFFNRGEWAYVIDGKQGKLHPASEKPLDKKALEQISQTLGNDANTGVTLNDVDFVHNIALGEFKTNPNVPQNKDSRRNQKIEIFKNFDANIHRKRALLDIATPLMTQAEGEAIIESLRREINKQEFVEEASAAGINGFASQEYQTFKKDFSHKSSKSTKRDISRFVELPKTNDITEMSKDDLARLQNFNGEQLSQAVTEMMESVMDNVYTEFHKEFELAEQSGYDGNFLVKLCKTHEAACNLIQSQTKRSLYSMIANKATQLIEESESKKIDTKEKKDAIEALKIEAQEYSKKVEALTKEIATFEAACTSLMNAEKVKQLKELQVNIDALTDSFKVFGEETYENLEINAEHKKHTEKINAAKAIFGDLTSEAKTKISDGHRSVRKDGKPILTDAELDKIFVEGDFSVLSKFVSNISEDEMKELCDKSVVDFWKQVEEYMENEKAKGPTNE